MKVALDISPINSLHSSRGIGSYTKNLRDYLQRLKIEIISIQNSKEKVNADVYHFPYFDFFFRTLNPHKNAKNIVTIHDTIPLLFPEHFPRGIRGNINLLLQKKALRKIDAVICVSHTSKKDVNKKLLIPENKIHVVYLAASSEFTKINDNRLLLQIAKKYQLPENFILYIGDVNWNKNVIGLLKAVKIANVNLVMVGKSLIDKSLSQVIEIENTIKTLKLETKVTRLGYLTVKDLVYVYNLATLTILPSFYEGFGLPVLESMACGTPVICSGNSSLLEIGKNTAIFCNAEDPKDIAQKIDRIYNLNSEKKKELSIKSISHAKIYNWQKVASETKQVYESVLKT